MHQYTFDGADDPERMQDKKGAAHLAVRIFGAGVLEDLETGVPGFDESSVAVKTHRGPGTDNAEGAYLRTESITFGQTVSFEVLFQASDAEISGGQFNLAYILSTRVENDRGYFLTQGGPLPSTGVQFASSIGNGHNASNTNTVSPDFVVGDWYYVSGSYTIGVGNVTWTNWIANLTAGDTVLTEVGPFTNSGGTYPIVSTPLGIGGRWDAQEAFSGVIDELTFYDAALEGADFQDHLNLITGASLGFGVEGDGSDLVFRWESKAGKRYNLLSSTDLSIDPASWPVFGGHENLEPTPDENTLRIGRPNDDERFFVIEEFTPPPVVVFADDFEGGQGLWEIGSTGATGTDWGIGTSAVYVANSGSFLAGTNVDGDYASSADVWLRSPVVDLSSAAAGATLSFQEIIDTDGAVDFGRIVVLDSTTGAELGVVAAAVHGFETEWRLKKHAVPPAALGKKVKFEFRFESDEFVQFTGWYLDDVEVTVP